MLDKNKKCDGGEKKGDGASAKYARMKKTGLPEQSVPNKMKMDGLAPIAEFFDDPLPKPKGGAPVDLSMHDLPEGSVRNKMKMDGIDAKVIAAYWG